VEANNRRKLGVEDQFIVGDQGCGGLSQLSVHVAHCVTFELHVMGPYDPADEHGSSAVVLDQPEYLPAFFAHLMLVRISKR
jgi:hypothetical protein